MHIHRRVLMPLCLAIGVISLLSINMQSVFAAAVADQGATASTYRRSHGLGWLEHRQGLRVVHLQGSPYDMGYQQGILLKDELMKLTHTMAETDDKKRSWTDRVWGFFSGLYQKTVVITRIKRDIPAAYLEELRGMAAGTNGAVTIDELLLLQYAFNEAQPHGSSFIALPDATLTNSVVHTYNLDVLVPQELWDLVTVFIYEPQEGEKIMAVGFPGMVGILQGMNATGLSATYQYVPMEDKVELPGVPGPILVRAALQYATSIDEAAATFEDWPRGNAIISMADSSSRAVVIEYSNQRISSRKPENELLAATAVYRTPALLPLTRSADDTESRRHELLQETLEDFRGKLNLQAAVAVMRERQSVSALISGQLRQGIANMHTITSVLMDPIQRWLWVAWADEKAPAPYHRYFAFSIDDELGANNGPEDIAASPILGQQTGVVLAALRRAYLAYNAGEQSAAEWASIVSLLEQASAQQTSAVLTYWLGVANARSGKSIEAVKAQKP